MRFYLVGLVWLVRYFDFLLWMRASCNGKNPEKKVAVITPLKNRRPISAHAATTHEYPLVAIYDLVGDRLHYPAPNEARES